MLASRAPQFLAGLVELDRVSRDRLDAAIVTAQPLALAWCDEPGSRVDRRLLSEALIASLPQALRLTWAEVLRRSRRNAPTAPSTWPAKAMFRPQVDVFDGDRPPQSVTLLIEVNLELQVIYMPAAPIEVRAELRLAIDHPVAAGIFHEVTRELVLPATP